MAKIENDKYYTPPDVAKRLIDLTLDYLKKHDLPVTDIIEPSAGNGSFSNQIDCTAYDILPQNPNIIQADFLVEPIEYKKGRLCIGNPPFGTRNNLSIRFYKKCCEIGDYIAFIQPISQLNSNLQMYEFDLIYSEDLGEIHFSDRILHCCFNIYIRPANGLNQSPIKDISLKDVSIVQYRRNGPITYVPPEWDYAFCSWGNGCFGKIPSYVGEYSTEIYVYIHNEEKRDEILNLLKPEILKPYAESISTCGIHISKLRLYQYLQSNLNLKNHFH